MIIEKTATRSKHHQRAVYWYESARCAFKSFLRERCVDSSDLVLLPAYIGLSPKEGSGVFDPVTELGLRCQFYRLDASLRIDVEDLRNRLRQHSPKVLLLIHYFGSVDPSYAEVVRLAREQGVAVLEDEAHAMLSDVVGGVCGRLGDACIMSLHKLLPLTRGGLLVVNPGFPYHEDRVLSESVAGEPSPFAYDLLAISERRRTNAALIAKLLRPLAGEVDPLWSQVDEKAVPQTYPVVVERACRDDLYFAMNQAGFGVVSLYHTLVPQIEAAMFPDSAWLSRHILNLPVHQDAGEEQLTALVDELSRQVRSLGRKQ